jgi:Putative metal-binding motif
VIAMATTMLLAASAPCTALGMPLVEHACLHAKYGPFADGAQNVNQVHTYFRIALPPGEGPRMVTYVPARSGEWAVFRNPGVPLAMLDPAGRPLTARFEPDVAGCPELPRVSVFDLDANRSYRLALGPAAAPEVGLVLEKLTDFAQFYYADQDGDGHGDPGREAETACIPPPGHVEADDDCDDRAAEVHPRASELCNGRDDDCDGITDESCPGGPRDAGPAAGSCQLVGAGAGSATICGLLFIAALLRVLRRRVRAAIVSSSTGS